MADGEGVAQLRSLYNLCCPDENGFIVTDVLAGKLADQFNDQAVHEIKSALDPQNKGSISFEDFYNAFTTLNSGEGKESILNRKPSVDDERASLSDPEFTYNEYDIAEDDFVAGEMENFEAFGESNTLSPIQHGKDACSNGFIRNSSFRKSHRRNRSWASPQQASSSQLPDDTSSVSSELDDLSEKVDILQDHVTRLTEEKTLQASYDSVMQENQHLTTRVHELDEKLQDAVERINDLRVSSAHKVQDVQAKLERETELQVQVLQGQINMLTRDLDRAQLELAQSRTSNSEAREEGKNMRKMAEELTQQLMETNEQYRKLSQQFTQQQEKHDHERQRLKDDTAEMGAQLYQAQHAQQQAEQRLEAQAADHSDRLRAHVTDLHAENSRLKHTNDELNARLAQNITDVRSMIGGPGSAPVGSLADEMCDASKDELMSALSKQQHDNEQLRGYLDRIILSVLERDPGILEIKPA